MGRPLGESLIWDWISNWRLCVSWVNIRVFSGNRWTRLFWGMFISSTKYIPWLFWGGTINGCIVDAWVTIEPCIALGNTTFSSQMTVLGIKTF